MCNLGGNLIFVGALFLIVFVIIYYSIKKFKKKKKKYPKEDSISSFKCLDSHFVKSKGELIIDNYLYILDIRHSYEKKIKILNKNIKCDWFLPEYNVYIEYWGFHGKNYLKRKKEKIKLYRKAKLKLISIENYMFSDIYSYLNKKLRHSINDKRFFHLDTMKKYCYNCGIILDERF